MNEEELLAQAQAALQAGKSPEGVNARIAELSGGRYRDVRMLELRVRMASRLPGAAGRDTTAPENITEQPSPIRDYIRAAAQGATFGFADEIAGAAAGVAPGGQTYDEARDASQARIEQIRRERPIGSFIAEAAGGLLVPGGAGASIGRQVVARGGSRLAAGLIGGGVAAAGAGALSGAGESEPGERLSGAAIGGTVGGVLGMLTGAGAGAAGRAINKAAGHTGEMEEFARARVRAALEEAGVNPEEMAQRLRELGPGSVTADLGENLGREARAAVNKASSLAAPGGPKSRIVQRQMERGERLSDELRSASRLGRSFDESLEEAENLVTQVRENFYRPLEAQYPVVDGANVAEVLQLPAVARVARRVAPEATDRPPSFRELQDIMMELRDEMTAARASGRPNRSRKAAEAFDQLMEAIETDVPEFGPAQRAYRIASKRVEAHDMGRRFAFRKPRDIQAELGKLPEEAQDAFRMGMLDEWETALRTKPSGGSKASEMIDGGRTAQEKLRILVGDDARLDELLRGMEREQRWQATYRALSGNSTTAQQQNDVLSQMAPSVRETVWRMVTGVFGLSPQQRIAAAEMIGRTLLAEGPEAAEQTMNSLKIRFSRPGAAGAVAGSAAARELFTSRGGLLED